MSDSSLIEAAVCRTFNQPLVIEKIRLAPPGPGEVRVKIEATAICHSDIFYMEGAWGGELPAVYGHEAAGRITAIGPNVSAYKPGDRVLVTLIRSCGGCVPCQHGRPVLCETSFPLDKKSPLQDINDNPVTHGLRTAAFAQETTVDQSQLVLLPDDIKPEVAALLSCGVITGVGAVTNSAQMPAGSIAAVIGCGGVGLNAVQGAFLAGASQVLAIDVNPDKLKSAKLFGATDVFAPDEGLRKAIKAATSGRMADYVFVTVGVRAAMDQAMRIAGRGGSIVMVGMPPTGVMAEYDPSILASLGHRIIGSKMGDTVLGIDVPRLITLYQQGRLRLDDLITARFPLSEINTAIDQVRQGQALRNVIMFGDQGQG